MIRSIDLLLKKARTAMAGLGAREAGPPALGEKVYT
jgi:hypothetical protein